jgi:hypothetical protein
MAVDELPAIKLLPHSLSAYLGGNSGAAAVYLGELE